MADPSFSTVHLTMRFGSQELAIGTGVLYERGARYYIATAWHNLSGRHSWSLTALSSKKAVPDNVVAIIGQTTSYGGRSGGIRMPFTIPLETNEESLYLVHPEGWPRIDVAVIPIDPDKSYTSEIRTADGQQLQRSSLMRQKAQGSLVSFDIQPIQHCAGTFGHISIAPDELIDPGDSLFVLGYPRGIADYMATPIWKRATVASDPHGGWNRQPMFLIDCASREGMSGAPVIAYSKTGQIQVGKTTVMGSSPSTALHGIYVGRLIDEDVPKDDRFFEAQIGTVWKRSVIDEIIDAQVPALHSSEIDVSDSKIKAAVKAVWTKEAEHAALVLEREELRWAMVNVTMVHLKGNAHPRKVYEEVLSHARALITSSSKKS